MKGSAPVLRFESRWPVALSILTMLFLLAVLPDRIRLYPSWIAYVLGVAVLVPLACVELSSARQWWRDIERIVILVFVVVVGAGTLVNLANLTVAMLFRSAHTSGLQLLTSSIALWTTNVFVFSLLYWQIDRGGPENRIDGAGRRPDWLFPQEAAPAADVPVPRLFYCDGVQHNRGHAADAPRQVADDAGKHDFTRHDRPHRITCDQHSRQLVANNMTGCR
jgi:hypothetical protein